MEKFVWVSQTLTTEVNELCRLLIEKNINLFPNHGNKIEKQDGAELCQAKIKQGKLAKSACWRSYNLSRIKQKKKRDWFLLNPIRSGGGWIPPPFRNLLNCSAWPRLGYSQS